MTTAKPYYVELTGPHKSSDGRCSMCRIDIGADGFPLPPRRAVYDLSLVRGDNTSDTWRLCREHIKEVRTALRGTIT